MAWKINHHEHDPRLIDLMAVFALLILIAAAWRFYADAPHASTTASFIVPSQYVHW